MEKTLQLTVRKNLLPFFSPLFQKGVILKTPMGESIRDLLFHRLGISDEYMEKRIQTVFLNGKAVDDLEATAVRDGSTLALSAAMPGLAGATLRRGGTFASFRQAITLTSEKEPVSKKESLVTLKLFNLLVSELGPRLLAKGVWVKGEDLIGLLGTLKNELEEGFQVTEEGGRKTEVLRGERSRFGKEDLIFLSVAVE